MNRKRKAIGLALLALLAMGVLATLAHSEEGKGEFTAVETPGGKNVEATYYGQQASPHSFRTAKARVECTTVELAALVEGGTMQDLTVTPFYGGCHLVEPIKKPVTLHLNECDYDFIQPVELKKDEYAGTMNLNCPTGKKIEIEIFEFGNTTDHSGLMCTISYLPAAGLGKTTYEDKTTASPTQILAIADVEKMTYEEKGPDCPDGEGKFNDGELEGTTTIDATTAAEKQIDAMLD